MNRYSRIVLAALVLIFPITGLAEEKFTCQSIEHTHSVVGQVKARDGSPVANAAVGLVFDEKVKAVQDTYADLELSTLVDERGHFELVVPACLDKVEVVARAEHFLVYRNAPLSIKGGATTHVEAVLDKGFAVEAKVVDQEERPIANATVALRRVDDTADTTPEEFQWQNALSDEHGVLTIGGLLSGDYASVAEADNFIARHDQLVLGADAGDEELVFTLSRATFARGIVVDRNGTPIHQAAIQVAVADETDTRLFESDKDGEFRLGPFAHGTKLALTTTAAGHGFSRTDDVYTPRADLVVVLSQNGAVVGQVLDAMDHSAITSFHIEFHPKETAPVRTSARPSNQSLASPDGSFRLTDVLPGNWTATISAKGYQPKMVPGIFVPTGETSQEVIVLLEKGHAVSGRVYDSVNGSPVSGALVAVGMERGYLAGTPQERSRQTRTGDDGVFTLEGLPAGAVTFDIYAVDYADRKLSEHVVEGLYLDVSLIPAATVRGNLFHSDGRTPVQGYVFLENAVTGVGGGIPTKDDGHFVFTNVDHGPYRVWAESPHGATKTQDVFVAEGRQSPTISLSLVRGARLSGRVIGLLPGEFTNTKVRIKTAGGFVLEGVVNAFGDYEMEGVPAGEATVAVETANGRAVASTIEIDADRSTILNFSLNGDSRIQGKITRHGRGVPFVSLTASPLDGQDIQGSGETTSSGQYTIEGIERGAYLVSIVGGESKRIVVDGDTELDFALSGNSIAGKVIDAVSREPVGNVSIAAASLNSSARLTTHNTTSSHLGEFELRGVEPGHYELTAFSDEYDIAFETVEVGEEELDHEIVLYPTDGQQVRVKERGTDYPLTVVSLDVARYAPTRARFTVKLDERGVGQIPRSLVGTDIGISWIGYERVEIERWSGGPVEVSLSRKGGNLL